MFDSILFDLDGTLWDAVPAVAESWTLGLKQLGIQRPPITAEELFPCMGMLLSDIADVLLPGLTPEKQDEAIRYCCNMENAYLAQHGAALCPGVKEALPLLSQKYPLFIVSNCQTGYIEAFYEGSGLGKYFTGFESAGNTGLPKSENIKLVVQRHGLKNPVYVGDTALDHASAAGAGIPFVFASYGFGSVENTPSIRSLTELPELLEGWDS